MSGHVTHPERRSVADRVRRLAHVAARAPVVAGASWALVWLLLTITGQGYSLRALYAGYQIVPAAALFDDPFGSVWNLHIQPPTWNLLIGAIGAWSPFGLVLSFQVMSLVWGVLLAATLCATLGHLGAPTRWAIGLTLVGTSTTEVLAHAFEPRYDFAVAAMLSLLVWSVARTESPDARWTVAVPVLVATLIVSTRTLYHPVWLVGVAILVAWSFRSRSTGRELTIALVVPIVVLGAVMVKNEVVVGRFTLSTLTGMNLERSISPAASDADLRAMTAEGEISDIWAKGLAGWALDQPCEVVPDDHPVLASPYRVLPPEWQTGPFDDGVVPNYNARCFLPAYEQAAHDARELVVTHPGAWVRGRAWAVNNWFGVVGPRPAETSPLWGPMNTATRAVLVGVPHPPLPASWEQHPFWAQSSPVSLLLVVLTAMVLVGAAHRLRTFRALEPASVAVVLTGWIVVWTIAVGVVFELGEQVRFRNAIDPLVVGVGGWLLLDWLQRRRSLRSGTGSER